MMSATLANIGSVPRAIHYALGDQRAKLWGGVLFVVAFGFYLLVLPATATGGAIGWVSLRWLTPGEAALALIMAMLLGLTALLGVYGLRQGAQTTQGKSVLGALLAVLPTLLCCSPILPITLTAVASVLPIMGTLGLPLQGFISTHEALIYGVAIALMAWGLYGNARRALSCAC
ncbi:MAG: hypothetical protein KGQ46_14290 [Hyphomicrobiales bacterium]|nr:hypothetical protein [Hyphomicrobiales bacterium]MDE2115939.1 hypothetical protein [Hyphomicrobiales bacterium]